jgi:selenocysteine lyase/cysteine desulfurase
MRVTLLTILLSAALLAMALGRSLPAPRSDFLMPANMSYHNVGTLGPATKYVVQAAAATNLWLESNPDGMYFEQHDNAITRMQTSRQKAAEFLSVSVDEVALIESTTVALNTVSTGLIEGDWFAATDRVLMTDQEHAGATSGWLHYANLGRIGGIDTVPVPITWNSADQNPVDALVARFVTALQSPPAGTRYRVLAVPHVLTTTGVALPLDRLAAAAHAVGALFIVDGAQAPGGLAVNVTATGADVYACSAHKWLLSAKASALLVIRRATQSKIKTTFLDGGMNPYTGQTGTRSTDNFVGLGVAIDYLSSFDGGLQEVQAYNIKLRHQAFTLLQALAIPGLEVLSPPPFDSFRELWSPLLTVVLPAGLTSQVIANELFTQFAIVVKMTGATLFPSEWPVNSPPYALRISFHVFNTESEVQLMVAAIGQVVSQQLARLA